MLRTVFLGFTFLFLAQSALSLATVYDRPPEDFEAKLEVSACFMELGDEVLTSLAWLEVSWEEPRLVDPHEEFWWSPTWQATASARRRA